MDIVQPEVGMGVTKIVGSDRYPATIVRIITPKKIVVKKDNYKLIAGSCASEDQTYEYSPDETASEEILTLRKNGRWVSKGESMKYGGWSIGVRRAYSDPCF